MHLDTLAARHGLQLVETCPANQRKDLENALNATLGILRHDGLYAAILWLHEDKPGRDLIGAALNALALDPAFPRRPEGAIFDPAHPGQALNRLRDTYTSDLATLCFVRELFNRALIYARQRVKAI